jgi:hypothetical protein
MAEQQESNPEPTGSEVLRLLAHELNDLDWVPSRISVEQGTPYEWACRAYYPDGREFEGHLISFERSG